MPAQPRSTVCATRSSQGYPAATRISTAPLLSARISMGTFSPLRCTTVPSNPSSLIRRLEPPPTIRSGSPCESASWTARSSPCSSRGRTSFRAGPPTPNVVRLARSTWGEVVEEPPHIIGPEYPVGSGFALSLLPSRHAPGLLDPLLHLGCPGLGHVLDFDIA